MSETISDLEILQDTVLGRITNDIAFSTLQVLDERKGNYPNDLAQTLGSITIKGGKKGAAVVVCTPFFDVSRDRCPGPRIDPKIFVRCIERPLINRSPQGTGVTAEMMAINVIKLLHFYLVQGLDICIEADKGDPVEYANGERELVVTLKTSLQLEPLSKCALPVIAVASLTVTLTCATAGAAIWYTTDGSFPNASAAAPSTATLYAAPFTVATGTLVRTVAYSPTPTQQVASDLAAQEIKS